MRRLEVGLGALAVVRLSVGGLLSKMDYSSRLPNELPFFIRIRGFAEYGIDIDIDIDIFGVFST